MFFFNLLAFFLMLYFPYFLLNKYQYPEEKNTHLIPDLYSNILLNDFGFWDFSRLHGHIDGCGKSIKKCTWYAVEVWN